MQAIFALKTDRSLYNAGRLRNGGGRSFQFCPRKWSAWSSDRPAIFLLTDAAGRGYRFVISIEREGGPCPNGAAKDHERSKTRIQSGVAKPTGGREVLRPAFQATSAEKREAGFRLHQAARPRKLEHVLTFHTTRSPDWNGNVLATQGFGSPARVISFDLTRLGVPPGRTKWGMPFYARR